MPSHSFFYGRNVFLGRGVFSHVFFHTIVVIPQLISASNKFFCAFESIYDDGSSTLNYYLIDEVETENICFYRLVDLSIF